MVRSLGTNPGTLFIAWRLLCIPLIDGLGFGGNKNAKEDGLVPGGRSPGLLLGTKTMYPGMEMEEERSPSLIGTGCRGLTARSFASSDSTSPKSSRALWSSVAALEQEQMCPGSLSL